MTFDFLKEAHSRKLVLYSLLAGFLIGLPINGPLLLKYLAKPVIPKEWREGQRGLINPLLGVNYPDKTVFEDLKSLQQQLNLKVQSDVANGKATRVSVYFKDQSNSHWTGVNETDTFAPASLIKIPMMITYFKVSETHPDVLNQTLQYTGPDQNKLEVFKPTQALVPGQFYTVSDLIRRMIVYSDNNAILMLFNNMDKKTLDEVFGDLSISIPADVTKNEDYITPGNFSRFFRILYNSSYLNERDSEKALDLMSQAAFKDGLVAGVPVGTTVAHKFGETPDIDASNTLVGYELHDCGIVYYPSRPYVLCVMTEGASYVELSNVIKDISATVYTAVTKLK